VNPTASTIRTPTIATVGRSAPLMVLPEIELAYTACDGLLKGNDSVSYDLVFLYGPSGLGKTHLAQLTLHRALAEEPETAALFKNAAEFIDEFTEAAQKRTVPQFQNRYSQLRFFVLDDFPALENHPETQLQLLHLLDHILAHSGRVILTSSKSPGQLNGFSQRLVNRLIGGTCVPITPYGPTSRHKLLTHFSSTEMIPISSAVAEELARMLPVSPRELRGSLRQLEAAALALGHKLELDFIKKYLEGEATRPELGLAAIARAAAREFEVSVAQLRSKNRTQQFAKPRQCAMYVARELTDEPLQAIGHYFGERNHATVVYACRQIKQQLEKSPETRLHITQILQSLGVSTAPDC